MFDEVIRRTKKCANVLSHPVGCTNYRSTQYSKLSYSIKTKISAYIPKAK